MRQNSWTQVVVWRQELCRVRNCSLTEAPPRKPRAATTQPLHFHSSDWQHINPKTIPVQFLTLTLAWAWRNGSAGFGAKRKNHWPPSAQTVYWILHTERWMKTCYIKTYRYLGKKKKVSKNLSLPRFFSNVAALSKILLASFGFYIHKTECANPASYK